MEKMSEKHLLNTRENCFFVWNGKIIYLPFRSDSLQLSETINNANMTDICL